MEKREVWFGRVVAVALGVVVAACSVSSVSARIEFPQPDMSKKPRMEHILNQDFGTRGVSADLRILDYDMYSAKSRLYGEVRIEIAVSGFRGPVTVWAKNRGTAGAQKITAQPWVKLTANPRKGVIIVTVPLAKRGHCAALAFRINDEGGRWTKAFTEVRVRGTENPPEDTGGTISF